MHVGPCSALADEEESSQKDNSEFSFMLTHTSHMLECLVFPNLIREVSFAKGDI